MELNSHNRRVFDGLKQETAIRLERSHWIHHMYRAAVNPTMTRDFAAPPQPQVDIRPRNGMALEPVHELKNDSREYSSAEYDFLSDGQPLCRMDRGTE